MALCRLDRAAATACVVRSSGLHQGERLGLDHPRFPHRYRAAPRRPLMLLAGRKCCIEEARPRFADPRRADIDRPGRRPPRGNGSSGPRLPDSGAVDQPLGRPPDRYPSPSDGFPDCRGLRPGAMRPPSASGPAAAARGASICAEPDRLMTAPHRRSRWRRTSQDDPVTGVPGRRDRFRPVSAGPERRRVHGRDDGAVQLSAQSVPASIWAGRFRTRSARGNRSAPAHALMPAPAGQASGPLSGWRAPSRRGFRSAG